MHQITHAVTVNCHQQENMENTDSKVRFVVTNTICTVDNDTGLGMAVIPISKSARLPVHRGAVAAIEQG